MELFINKCLPGVMGCVEEVAKYNLQFTLNEKQTL